MHQKGYVLVLESDDSIRELLERWLGEAGYGVRVRPEGQLDARAPNGEAPLLVIANISAPRRAPDLLEAIRALYAAPILLLSARFRRGLGASREVARTLRVQGVLPKPFARAELLAAVRRSMEGRP